ncbi:MAG: helix-turn-helix transcriptional regulator [Acidobacteria bacterium]|nr:helix-turn-helix transcriptional regulator [Acidobacteriota bacterium]
MIEITIKAAAKKVGITSGYQLQRTTGFDVSMSARLWKGEWKRIDIKTLNKLCNALKCTPNDILRFKPDKEI